MKEMPEDSVEEVPKLDVSALIVFWYLIRGGQPAPAEVMIDSTAVQMVVDLDRYLCDTVAGVDREGLTGELLRERLKSLGVELVQDDEHHRDRELSVDATCFCYSHPLLLRAGQPPPDPDEHKPTHTTTCICL
jgi:hypothetical protein